MGLHGDSKNFSEMAGVCAQGRSSCLSSQEALESICIYVHGAQMSSLHCHPLGEMWKREGISGALCEFC